MAFAAFISYYYAYSLKKKNEEIVKIKNEFLFRTVHDLRSPATNIRFLLERYEDPAVKNKDADIKYDLELIKKLDSSLLNLIQDILVLAKSRDFTDSFRREKINLQDLIRNILVECNPVIIKKAIDVEYTPPENLSEISGDKEKVKEVFLNLIDNAIKYNIQGGKLEIKHEVRKNFVRTSIKDEGAGIAAEHLSKLFTPYFRGDAAKTVVGTGLGLYIVKNLTESMGGRVMVNSVLGKGSTFYVELPVSA